MNNTELTTITLEEWLKRAEHVRTATKELVRLWMVNDLGCQKELANHLGVDKSTISRHVKALVKEGKLEPSDSNQGKRNDLKRSCRSQLAVENAEVAVPNSPAAAIPYAQPIDDQLDEARQRVKELEAELEQAREASETQTVSAPSAEVEKLQKKLDRKTKLIRQRDRKIRELERLVPKSAIGKLQILVETDPDLQGASVKPAPSSRKWTAEFPDLPLEEAKVALDQLLHLIKLHKGNLSAANLRRFSEHLACCTLDFWQEYQELGGPSHEIRPIDDRLTISRNKNTVVDVESICTDEEG